MNYSEVKELLQAGFTADEIRTMMNPQANNPQNTQDNPQPEPKQPEEQPQPDQKDQPQPDQKDQTQDDARFTQLNATMEKLIKTIQSSNLNNNSFDHMKETDINTEVDKIMAGIIRPEREKGGTEK